MTKPRAETIEQERHKLYVTDAELIRILGVPPKLGRAKKFAHLFDASMKSKGLCPIECDSGIWKLTLAGV